VATAGLGARRSALDGVMVPETTPFGADGGIDERAFEDNVRAHLAAGVLGIVTAGSTGEAALLGKGERARLVECARALVSEDGWLIAGVGAESTRATVRRARTAALAGADAVLVVAPHYYGAAMTDTALETHYRRVADDSPVPVILYNIPKYAHFALSAALVAALAKHENIVGIKDSSGDLDSLRGYLSSQSEAFTVLTGSGGTLLAALELGARGGILAVGCFAARTAVDVFEAHGRGDRAAARSAQEKLVPLSREIVGALGPAGIKAAMDAVGLRGGAVRGPLTDLDAAQRLAIARLLA
jgi:4-hydroxy-2-oxoglutarate aldolase